MERVKGWLDREQCCFFAGFCAGLGMHDLMRGSWQVGVLFVGIGFLWRFWLLFTERREVEGCS